MHIYIYIKINDTSHDSLITKVPARFQFLAGARICLFATTSTPALALTKPRVQCLDREADHSRYSNAEIKNARSYASAPPYVFMAW
jgi:hypothetical protein